MKNSGDSAGTDHVAFVDIPIRVRYGDTDKMGVVYYGIYPLYFEMARSEYLRAKGFTYKKIEEMGYYLVVVDLAAKYYNNAGYDDLVIAKTSMPELRSRGLTFHYNVYKDDTLLVQGHTKHLCISREEKKAVAIPPHLMKILKDAQAK
jgi:acyl-CoA thioester hydrolase